MKRWTMLIDSYSGIEKKAVNMLSGFFSGYLNYVLPVKYADKVSEDELKANNVIFVGKETSPFISSDCRIKQLVDVPKLAEAYAVFVGESIYDPENQMIIISGFDEAGVLYGCMDFCNKYCGDILYKNEDIWGKEIFSDPFGKKINDWSISLFPAIKHRAIWTWGHVIYDYRSFFENMARLKLNEIVIWNDRAPLNASDVVEYAHSLGIKVIFGFAWGWGLSCSDIIEKYNEEEKIKLKESVIRTYETEYLDSCCDGIYFQSFTELNKDYINGKCIAELVTELVNDVAGALLSKYPGLHIQFGLHATSVKKHLDFISKVDERVHIVWEDCGAFPYSYWADQISDYDETCSLSDKLLSLRGNNERFGAVFKGMLKLDWNEFEHFDNSYILGERTENYINSRQQTKNRIWKIQQASWIENANYFRKIIALIANKGNDCIVQGLVEDSMFENKIMLPVAIFAEMMWTPNEDTNKLIGQVSKYPCVHFANI